MIGPRLVVVQAEVFHVHLAREPETAEIVGVRRAELVIAVHRNRRPRKACPGPDPGSVTAAIEPRGSRPAAQ